MPFGFKKRNPIRRLSQILRVFSENLNFMLLPCCLTHLQKKQLVLLMTKIFLIISCLRNKLQPLWGSTYPLAQFLALLRLAQFLRNFPEIF